MFLIKVSKVIVTDEKGDASISSFFSSEKMTLYFYVLHLVNCRLLVIVISKMIT